MKKLIPVLFIIIASCTSNTKSIEEKAQIINQADSLILQIDNKMIEFDERLLEENKSVLKEALAKLKEARDNQELAEIDSATSILNSTWNKAYKIIKMSNRPIEMISVWSAKWETPADSYPDLTDTEFYMNGEFTFTKDSLKIENKGFPGCIFNIDTIAHTQSWYVSNDTLFLFNDPEVLGMSYLIKSKEDSKIELQLMDDIFVTLTK